MAIRLLRPPPTIAIPDGGVFAKERALLEIVRAERAQGRRVFVYAVYAERHDVVGRLTEILRAQGFRTEALRASVSPEEREEWLERAVRRGVEVLVGNPALVQTGLDLIDFPTLVFYETGYSIYLLRQASRRSWRIGQTRPVRVICLCYHGTMQERALQLMGRKLLSSLMLEGKISTEGLTALAEGTDLAAELARALTEGLRGVESAETIWRRLSPASSTLTAEDTRGTAQGPTELPALATTPPAAAPAPAAPLTHVILTTIKGRRRSARVVPVEELDRTAGQPGFAWLLADAAAP